MPHLSRKALFTLRRREWLGAAAAATALTALPWNSVFSAGRSSGPSDFVLLSQRLTGRATLDTAMGKRIYDALVTEDARFPDQSQQLLHLIESRRLTDDQLLSTLSSEKPALAHLPAQIMTAWFLGVVGSGMHARVLAFEHALNAQAVADQLRPPTYAYGAPGSWSLAPTPHPEVHHG